MGNIFQILLFIIAGIILLWFGYNLFFGKKSPFYMGFGFKKRDSVRGKPGDAMTCPICSMRLIKGDLVKSIVFPNTQSFDRLMYIRGCPSCIDGSLPRRCPVCKEKMTVENYLVARLFSRPGRKGHMHVLGCNNCKKLGAWASQTENAKQQPESKTPTI